MDRLGQERFPDIPVRPFLLSPALRLTGQYQLILWITGCRAAAELLPGLAVGAFEAADGFLVMADFGGDGLEAAA